jgi:hypothetical protein
MIGVVSTGQNLVFNGTSGIVFVAPYDCIVYFCGSARGSSSSIVNILRAGGLTSNMKTGFRDNFGAILKTGESISVSTYPFQYRIITMRLG